MEPRERPLDLVIAAWILFTISLVPNLTVLASRDLGAMGYTETGLGAIMGTFHVASLVAMPVAGRLMSRIGIGIPVLCGGVVAAAGCVVFAVADGTALLAVGRAGQGIGFAAGLVGGFAWVAEVVDGRHLANRLGATGAVILIAQLVGPVGGEMIVSAAGWDALYYVAGVAGLSAALGAIAAPRVRPLIEAARFRRGTIAMLVATALAGGGFGAVVTFLADATESRGLSGVSPFFAAYVGVAVAARLIFGAWADRAGRRGVATLTLAVQALALLGVAVSASSWQLALAGAGFGVGHGLSYPALQALVVACAGVPRARAIAAFTFSFGVGITLASFALGPVAQQLGYPAMYIAGAGVSGLGAALLAVRRQP